MLELFLAMASPEVKLANTGPEKRSLLRNSILFEAGLVFLVGGAVAFAVFHTWEPAVLGVIMTGAATAWWKGREVIIK